MARILLVDDDPLLVRMYQKKFENDGYEVITANDGEDVFQKLSTTRPDLILLDIMMPKMNGLQVLEQIKATEAIKTIPVVMLSNVSGSESDTMQALELGAVAYLVKSNYTPKEVVQKVKEILSAYVHEVPKVQVQMKDA
jgi:two-component system alkaline phosphatase synthesis response regulator PhoP